jgi:hypothetical protein
MVLSFLYIILCIDEENLYRKEYINLFISNSIEESQTTPICPIEPAVHATAPAAYGTIWL